MLKRCIVTAGLLSMGLPAAAQETSSRAVRRVSESIAVEARAIVRAYQGRFEERETFSRRVTLGRDGRVFLSNVRGDITVTAGPGDEVTIEAVKRTRGSRGDLSSVAIEVDERPSRLEIRTRHPRRTSSRISVDFTLQVPESAAVELRSVSGTVRVTNVSGSVRAESVSGELVVAGSPRVEFAKSVSGNIDVTGVSSDADLEIATVSGNVRARGVKARALQFKTVSGNILLTDATVERLEADTVSGGIEYSGTLARGGRYDVHSHSGDVRLTLTGDTGFELTANTFSGDIRSELPVTLGGGNGTGRRTPGRRSRSVHATFGDASAVINARTFSGDLIISRSR